MPTKATKTTTTPTDTAERLGVEDLDFLEREVFAFAFHEEGATADPKESVFGVVDRAMARVTPFLLERRKRLAVVQPAGKRA